MLSVQGDGYTLGMITNSHDDDTDGRVDPGVLFNYSGNWTVNDFTIPLGHGVELSGNARLSGSGRLALLQIDNPDPKMLTPDMPIVGCHQAVVSFKNWGYELEIPTRLKTHQLKMLHVFPGHRTSQQYHVHKDEVMLFFGPDNGVRRSSTEHFAPGDVHRVSGPATYFEASTYHPDDVVRLADDYGRAPKRESLLLKVRP